MLEKQFKISNSKMNSILQFLANTRHKNALISVDVNHLLKPQESRLKDLIDDVDK